MKALVVYDSKWGNTEAIARAIAEGIGRNVKALKVPDVTPQDVEGITLLVLGSPVYGGRPSKPVQEYLTALAPSSIAKARVATFDTRITMKFAQKFGFAAVKMADQLKAQGVNLRSEPMGFIVTGQKGPLAAGELERATQWGKELAKGK